MKKLKKINLIYPNNKDFKSAVENCRFKNYLPPKAIGKILPLSEVNGPINPAKATDFIIIDLCSQPAGNAFDNFSNNDIKKIRNLGTPIILNFVTEAFEPHNFQWINQFLHSAFPENRKYILNGNLHYDRTQLSKNLFSYSLTYFDYSYRHEVDVREIIRSREQKLKSEFISVSEAFESQRHKDFVCFNGRNRPGRISLISQIVKHNLHCNSYFTYLGYGNALHDERDILQNFLRDDDKVKDAYNFIQGKKYTLDVEQYPFDDRQFDKKVFLDSFFSLVTETENLDNNLFLTEKTFKPIYTLHPFLMWSSKGHLRELRQRGYETFPELFDESYDDMPEHKRLSKVLENVNNFVKLSDSEKHIRFDAVKPKLLHNREIFLNRDDSDYRKIFWSKTLEIINKERELTKPK